VDVYTLPNLFDDAVIGIVHPPVKSPPLLVGSHNSWQSGQCAADATLSVDPGDSCDLGLRSWATDAAERSRHSRSLRVTFGPETEESRESKGFLHEFVSLKVGREEAIQVFGDRPSEETVFIDGLEKRLLSLFENSTQFVMVDPSARGDPRAAIRSDGCCERHVVLVLPAETESDLHPELSRQDVLSHRREGERCKLDVTSEGLTDMSLRTVLDLPNTLAS